MRNIFLISALFLCAFGVLAQNVTIRAVNRPASEVFRSIMEQTDKNFVYSSDLLKDMRITVNAKKKPLKKVLEEIFHDSDIEYKIKGKNVVLKKKKTEKPKKGIKQKREYTSSLHLSDTVKVTMLQPIEVVSQSENHPIETAKLGVNTLSEAAIMNTPALFGEPDLIKAVQLLPGVSESTAGLAGMNVHGGGPDENMYMLDNVPIYQVEHFAGLFSPFNPDIVKQSDFYKTSVPAKYDGRLSSFLDVKIKNGNRHGHHGSARLGLTAGAFNISGPIGGKTTYLLGIRRSWYDILSIPICALINSDTEEKITLRYHFMDANARIEHRFSPNTTAFISAYYGEDFLKTTTKENYSYFNSDSDSDEKELYKDSRSFNWGNFLIQTGIRHNFHSNLSGEFSLAYTKYYSNMGYDTHEILSTASDTISEREKMKSANFIHTFRAGGDFSWRPIENSSIRFGASWAYQSFLPERKNNEIITNDTSLSSNLPGKHINANEVDAYIEDDWKISDKLHAEGGIHVSLFNIDKKTKWGLSPRFSFSFTPSSNWALKTAYTRTVQYVHRMDETYLALPYDKWIPAVGDLKPMTADKISLGGFWQTTEGNYTISLEVYYKFMHNLIDFYDEYYLIVPAGMWSNRLTSGKGSAKGIDLSIEKKTGKITGRISYSLAWADRQFANRNGGHRYPARFDHRHTIKASLNWEISDKVSLNAFWIGHSGNRFTLLPQRFEAPKFSDSSSFSEAAPLRANINNYQLPFYHRLDLACNVKNRRGYWTFSLYNAYCNMNTIAIIPGHKKGEAKWIESTEGLWEYVHEAETPVFQKLKLIPIIPSVSYTWLF